MFFPYCNEIKHIYHNKQKKNESFEFCLRCAKYKTTVIFISLLMPLFCVFRFTRLGLLCEVLRVLYENAPFVFYGPSKFGDPRANRGP